MEKKIIGTMADSLEAGYLGVATDPTPNDHYSVAGALAGLPTPQSHAPLIAQVNEMTTAKIVSGEEAPAPTLSSLEPATAAVGSADLIMKCVGSNFDLRSVIYFNAVAEKTTFVSATEIQTTVRASTMTTAGAYPVFVRTSAPGGGETAPLNFTFTP